MPSFDFCFSFLSADFLTLARTVKFETRFLQYCSRQFLMSSNNYIKLYGTVHRLSSALSINCSNFRIILKIPERLMIKLGTEGSETSKVC